VPPLTYHLVPREEWLPTDVSQPYTPAAFDADGFVHCTDGAVEVAATANRYYSAVTGDLLVLTIDLARVSAPVRYEDPGRIYPHVYGPIPREAITAVRTMPRDASGAFLSPPR
jgi:uncharacterized protein (DUF952 family)